MAGSRKYKNAQNAQAESHLFSQVHRDIRAQAIYPRASMDSMSVLCKLSITCQKAEAETALPRILHCAAFALPESWQQVDQTKLAVIAMLKTHPHLLFKKGYTRLPSGQLVCGSPYQVILGSGDIWARKAIHEEIIPHIQDGEAQACEQYVEQFPDPGCALACFTREDLTDLKGMLRKKVKMSPNLKAKISSINESACAHKTVVVGVEEFVDIDHENAHKSVLFDKQEFVVIHQLLSENKREDLCVKLCEADMLHDARNKEQIALIKEDLKEIVAAISEDPCRDENVCGKATLDRTRNAIQVLLDHLAPIKRAIQTGLYSPPEIMKIILEVYAQNYSRWSFSRLSLFSYEVIGGAECVASAVDAQCYQKGIYFIDIDTGPDRRSSYLSGPARCPGLGLSSYHDVYMGMVSKEGERGLRAFPLQLGEEVARRVWRADTYAEFLSCKKSGLTKPVLPHTTTSRCVIC